MHDGQRSCCKSYQTKLVCTQCTKCVLCTIKNIKQWDVMNECPVRVSFSLGISSSSWKQKVGLGWLSAIKCCFCEVLYLVVDHFILPCLFFILLTIKAFDLLVKRQMDCMVFYLDLEKYAVENWNGETKRDTEFSGQNIGCDEGIFNKWWIYR